MSNITVMVNCMLNIIVMVNSMLNIIVMINCHDSTLYYNNQNKH